MKISNKSSSNIYRRPLHSTLDFDNEQDPAVIEQLVRAEYIVKQGIISNRSVLDVGCGTGYTCYYFSQFGKPANVNGLEIDRDLVDTMRKLNSDRTVSFDYYRGGSFPYKDQSFDVVTCFEVIEHVPSSEQKDILSEMSRVVKPDGVVIVSTPNKTVYSPDGISLNPDHICEIDFGCFRTLCSEYFKKVTILGQGLVDDRVLKRRQIRHRMSHLSFVKLLKALGAQKVARLLRKYCSSSSQRVFSSTKQNYRIGELDESNALIQIAICSLSKTATKSMT
jgi:ubiquinone/menaquinone biosynthesis C-methylase UbiE